jgi:hypothetical protein
MSDPVKDPDLETPIPLVWRPALRGIVDSLVRRDAIVGGGHPSVEPVSAEDLQRCLQAIEDYGDATLISLPEESWVTSVARWYGDRWRCLVDLWTEEDGRSDLVLDIAVFEDGPGYRFSLHLVYVP